MPDAEIERELTVLRQRVDHLELARREKTQPWFRRGSTIMSVVALLASLGTTVYTQIDQNHEEIRSRKEELRRLVTSLVELREEYTRRMATAPDPRQMVDTSMLNTKRMTYLEAAEFLAARIPRHISASEYNVLAWEYMYSSNFTQAERYFQRAVEVASNEISRVAALRSLAMLHFAPGPMQDFARGRGYFERAVAVVREPGDPYLIHVQGETYLSWGSLEFRSGFPAEGRDKLDRARAHFERLPPDYPMRAQMIAMTTPGPAPVGSLVAPAGERPAR